MLGLKLNHVSKRGYRYRQADLIHTKVFAMYADVKWLGYWSICPWVQNIFSEHPGDLVGAITQEPTLALTPFQVPWNQLCM